MSGQTASLHKSMGLKSRRDVRTWPLMLPAVGLLAIWAVVPLALTLWYAFQNYNLQTPPHNSPALTISTTWRPTPTYFWLSEIHWSSSSFRWA